MKRKKFNGFLVVLGVIILLLGYGVYRFFYSMNSLPQGEYIGESTSPQGTYTVKFYETSPALSVGGTRCELIVNKTGKVKNIYWEYNRYIGGHNEIKWENEEVVIINGKRLDVTKDIYDFRRK